MQNISEDMPVKSRWGLVVSAVLHLAFVAVLLFGVPELFPPAQVQSVHVELVEPEQQAPKPVSLPDPASKAPSVANEEPAMKQDAEHKPQAFENIAPERDVPQPEEPLDRASAEQPQQQSEVVKDEVAEPKSEAVSLQPVKPEPELAKAKEIHSKDLLSEPRVKQAIGKLPMKDRMVQICSIEALEQIRRRKAGAFPDILAPTGSVAQGTSFIVKNGAFRSQGKWYEVRFACQVSADAMAVVDFSYHIGQAIPENEWGTRALPKG